MFVLSVIIIIIIIIIKADRRFGKYHVICLFIIESYTKINNNTVRDYKKMKTQEEN